MKKTNFIILGILLIAGLSFLFFKTKESDTTLKVSTSFFQLKDTASITKLFTADLNGNQVLLERKNFYWTVNGKYRADRNSINNFFEPLTRMYIKAPVSDKHRDELIMEMTVGHRKVEVYRNGEKERTYYIGNATADGLGTYVFSDDENLDRPYIVHIPGWNGNLAPRFFTDELSWRSKKVFNTAPVKIEYLKVDYVNTPEHSYKVTYNSDGAAQLFDGAGKPSDAADALKIKEALMATNKLYFEDFLPKISAAGVDSVVNILPLHATISIKIAGKDETKALLKVYDKHTDRKGVEGAVPIDRYYVYFEGGDRSRMGLLQKGMGSKLLKKFDRFELSK